MKRKKFLILFVLFLSLICSAKSQVITTNSQYSKTDSAKFPVRAIENLVIIAEQAKITEKENAQLKKDVGNYILSNNKCDTLIILKDRIIVNDATIIQAHEEKDVLNNQIIVSQDKDIKQLVKAVKKERSLKKLGVIAGIAGIVTILILK